ncbi:hypothetical protein Tco_0344627 [Tanacetum coccineum]
MDGNATGMLYHVSETSRKRETRETPGKRPEKSRKRIFNLGLAMVSHKLICLSQLDWIKIDSCHAFFSLLAVNESLKLTEAISDLESLIESGSKPRTPLPPLENLHGASPSNDIDLPRTLSKRILCCMRCKKEDYRTSDHDMYTATLKRSENYKSRSSESSIGVRCNTCGRTVHSTTDHNDFDHFKRGSPSGTSTVDAQGV